MTQIDTKTLDAPRGAPDTQALSPEKLAELRPAERARVSVPTYEEAQKELGAAERALQEVTLAENTMRLASQEALRQVGLANQRVKLAHNVYDLALQRHRAQLIDPAARPRVAPG